MEFAERLVELRKQHGLTQKQLAKELNISEIGIQNYEGRRRKPTHDAFITIAEYFDVSLDYLAGRIDNPNSHKS